MVKGEGRADQKRRREEGEGEEGSAEREQDETHERGKTKRERKKNDPSYPVPVVTSVSPSIRPIYIKYPHNRSCSESLGLRHPTPPA